MGCIVRERVDRPAAEASLSRHGPTDTGTAGITPAPAL
jgi:hypothetical protein